MPVIASTRTSAYLCRRFSRIARRGAPWDFLERWHAGALEGFSGLACRVWMFYAAGGGEPRYHAKDETVAFRLGTTRATVCEHRNALIKAGLLAKWGSRVWVPDGPARGAA